MEPPLYIIEFKGMQLWILKTILGVSYISLIFRFADNGGAKNEYALEVLLTDRSGITLRSKLC
jgi:hypothetical protein